MTRYDVVVLGGGLVGCAAAYYLARSGARVLLIEQADLNREASGRNAGSLHFQLEYRLIRYGEQQAQQFAQIIPLSLVAISDWRGLEAELGASLEMELGGGLIVAESATDVAMLEQRQALQDKWSLGSKLLGAAEVRRMAPYLTDSVIAAGYFEHEGHANPRLVAPAFARNAMARGAEIRCSTRVTAIERDGAQWQVSMLDRENCTAEVGARAVLNAAGAWAGEIAAMAHLHLPIYAVPLTMNVTERAAPLIPHLVQHASKRLTLKQVDAGNFLVGGGWPSRLARSGASMSLQRRAEPVMQNAIENLAVFAPVVLIAHALGISNGATKAAVVVYFFARLAHYIVYSAAVPLARTLTFTAGWLAQIAVIASILRWI